MTYVKHEPCAACGNPDTCFMFGSARRGVKFWLCGPCYSVTPHAVGLSIDSIKKALEDTNNGVQPSSGMEEDQR